MFFRVSYGQRLCEHEIRCITLQILSCISNVHRSRAHLSLAKNPAQISSMRVLATSRPISLELHTRWMLHSSV